jgi:RHS repeat-associated protein
VGAGGASYGYDAYGGADDAPLVDTEALTTGDTDNQAPLNPYRYTGKRIDSGLATGPGSAAGYDMGARRYGPDIGRFLQQDMFYGALANLGLALDPLTQNSYALAGGNPISYIETDGHMAIADGGGGAAPCTSIKDCERRAEGGRVIAPPALPDAPTSSPTTSSTTRPTPTPTVPPNPWQIGPCTTCEGDSPYYTGAYWTYTGISAINDAGQGLETVKTYTEAYLDVKNEGFLYRYGDPGGRLQANQVNTRFRQNTALIESGTKLRYLSRAGSALAVVGGGLTYYDEVSKGHSEAEAVSVAGVSTLGGMGGAWAGAQAGMFVGSFFGPGGTIVGGLIGAGIGGFAGSEGGTAFVHKMWSWWS